MSQKLIDLKTRKLEILQQKHHYIVENKLWLFRPYPWQKKWWAAGKNNRQRLLMAANQVGKTDGSCVEFCYHLTGKYPPDWEGHLFRFPINAWALGVSYDQLKRVLQTRIMGKPGENGHFSKGFIPPYLIDQNNMTRNHALKDSIKQIKIRYEGGGFSTLSFLSYEQGQRVLMGDILDLILIDEEPFDSTIYPQLVMRTINGDRGRGGLVMLAFTPEYGTTELVYQFQHDLQPGQYFLPDITWDDAHHLTDENKKQMLAALPEYQRDMRSKGIASMGSGVVYPIRENRLWDTLDIIPKHFRFLNAIDFGVRHCALIFGAFDPDNDRWHIYDAIKCEDLLPRELALLMRAKGDWIPWAWPHDGHLPDRGSGVEQKLLYENEGVNMLENHATTEDGKMSREPGISRISDRMWTGRLMVARHLKPFYEEKRLYHRKEGLIIKKNDHVLDALRYLEMMVRYATNEQEIQGVVLEPSYLTPRYQ